MSYFHLLPHFLLYSQGVPKYGLIPINHSVSTTYAFNNSVSTTYPFNNSVFTTYPYIKSVSTTLPFSAFRQVSTDKKKKDQKQHLKILPLVLKPFISSLLTAIPILPLTSTRQSQHAPSAETYQPGKPVAGCTRARTNTSSPAPASRCRSLRTQSFGAPFAPSWQGTAHRIPFGEGQRR